MFGGEEQPPVEEKPKEFVVDPRNDQKDLGFVDVMGYKIKPNKTNHTMDLHQNLWIRFGCDTDKKLPGTIGKNSRYYQYIKQQQNHSKNLSRPKRSGIQKNKKTDIFEDYKKRNILNELALFRK